jgi:hypothetical protein
MKSETTKYFKHLNFIREDIREELDTLCVPKDIHKICDFGCGNGITTFGLALETERSECIGIDLFDQESTPNPKRFDKFIAFVAESCKNTQLSKNVIPVDLCKLISEKRAPHFKQGNIVLNQNLPQNIDLGYCKKVLINIQGKEYSGIPTGEDALISGLRNIHQSIRANGLLCVIEYDKEYKLQPYFERCKFKVIKRAQIERREIRSKGRTKVISTFTLYLCQKV